MALTLGQKDFRPAQIQRLKDPPGAASDFVTPPPPSSPKILVLENFIHVMPSGGGAEYPVPTQVSPKKLPPALSLHLLGPSAWPVASSPKGAGPNDRRPSERVSVGEDGTS